MEDIKTLAKKSKKEMEETISSQETIIAKQKEQIDYLENKISQMKSFVTLNSTPVSNEELICIEQISLIKTKSMSRELSLDEVKRLDILIKNLRLIREQSTDVTKEKDYRNEKEDVLVAAARGPEEDDQ